jgi:PAS domain S-box-containing protein
MDKTDLIYMALETMPNFLLLDASGTILFMNRVYANLLGRDLKDIVGRHVTEVIPGTRMMHILKTGDTEIGDVMTLFDHTKGRNVDLICNRRPLKKNGKIVGAMAVTTFEDISDIEKLHYELERIKKENETFRQTIRQIQGNPLTRIIGSSTAMQEIKQTISDFAKSNFTFLLTGETVTESKFEVIEPVNILQEGLFDFPADSH